MDFIQISSDNFFSHRFADTYFYPGSYKWFYEENTDCWSQAQNSVRGWRWLYWCFTTSKLSGLKKANLVAYNNYFIGSYLCGSMIRTGLCWVVLLILFGATHPSTVISGLYGKWMVEDGLIHISRSWCWQWSREWP